jgi:hypothetical protein
MTSVLKSLKFTALPARGSDPVLNRRLQIVGRLEEQKKLIEDPNHVRTTTRWTGKGENRHQVTRTQRVKPWWRETQNGIAFAVYKGTTPLEFEKGKTAIAARSLQELLSLMDSLIEATRAGELDDIIAKTPTRSVGKKRAA